MNTFYVKLKSIQFYKTLILVFLLCTPISQKVNAVYNATMFMKKKCQGTVVGGYCWHYGAASASCTTTCAGFGGVDAATINYAGTGGSLANCESVLTALGAPTPAAVDYATCANPNGCCYNAITNRVRCTNAATSQSTSTTNTRRACACAY